MLSLSSPVDRVRLLGRIEGVSFLLLLGIAMPLKYFADQPLAVTVVGWIHGVLFLALALVTFNAWQDRHLSFGQASLVAVGALLPFGPYVIERWLPGSPRHGHAIEVPAEVTRPVFLEWRDARRGSEPAEDLTNPYWCWLVESGESSWAVNQHFRGPDSYTRCCEGGQPAWSAERFGQSMTELPGGRIVRIAGEHEDHYDPDFFIYNDIIIQDPLHGTQILGYPAEVFPPTDFHSATLVDGQLVIIGNLGYPEQRQPGTTPVLVIETRTWEVRPQDTTGECPGWIHGHQARRQGRTIIISKGKVCGDDSGELVENFDDWQLDLDSWRWSRLTHNKASIHAFERADGEPSRLFELGMWEMHQTMGGLMSDCSGIGAGLPRETRRQLEEMARYQPPADIEAYRTRYQPAGVEHQPLEPEEEDSLEAQIEVQGVRVRYQEEIGRGVRLIIEGELPAATEQALVDDLRDKLQRAEGVEYGSRVLTL